MKSNTNLQGNLFNPFTEIENRRVAGWKNFLIAQPELLDDGCCNVGFPAGKVSSDPPGKKPAEKPDQKPDQRPDQKRAENTASPNVISQERVAASAAPLLRCWEDVPNIFALDVPPTEWMVQGILPRASVTLLAGEPGSYKTWLALALLRGVAAGTEFLGRKCAQSSVLYLDRENPLVVMRERLAVLGVEKSAGAACCIWGGWLSDAPPAIGDIRILEIARQRRPLIIFDSLIRFHAAADENSASEMAVVMGDLRALANAGATVVALHHKPKSEGAHYRGSSDIAGGVDTAWAVSRDRDAGLLRLECFKSRFAEEFSLTLRPELSGWGSVDADSQGSGRGPSVAMLARDANPHRIGDFVVTDTPEASTEQSDTEKLAEAIRRHPGEPKVRIVETSGVRRGRARALLERFEGQCWRSERGPNNATLYFPNESKPSGQPPDLPTGENI